MSILYKIMNGYLLTYLLTYILEGDMSSWVASDLIRAKPIVHFTLELGENGLWSLIWENMFTSFPVCGSSVTCWETWTNSDFQNTSDSVFSSFHHIQLINLLLTVNPQYATNQNERAISMATSHCLFSQCIYRLAILCSVSRWMHCEKLPWQLFIVCCWCCFVAHLIH